MRPRTYGLAIGIFFGGFFLAFFIPETVAGLMGHHDPRYVGISARDIVLLACGHFSLIGATILAFWRQRAAAWWLLAGGLITTAVLVHDAWGDFTPLRFLPAWAFLCLPMFLVAWLFLFPEKKRVAS